MLEVINQGSQLNTLPSFFMDFAIFITIFVLALIIGRILKFIIKKMPLINADMKNGSIVIVTIAQFTLLITVTISLLAKLGVQYEFIIGSLAILATAIGIAFTGVATNFIGGIYILSTHPFGVGDLIKTQGIEGIVEEIGINFSQLITMDRTVVKIPNGNLINASLLNYTEKTEEPFNSIFPSSLMNSSKCYLVYKKMIELKLDILTPPIPIKSVIERLDNVCNDFIEIFGAKPTYYFGRHDFRLELYLIIRAIDGYTIYNAWPYFMESIMKTVYQELQQERNV